MGFWISIVIVLVAFNITTCLCCLLKRDTLTAVSSREEFTQLLKGLPGDFAALCHSIIPCLINPLVWVTWLCCCFKGCAVALLGPDQRAQISPSEKAYKVDAQPADEEETEEEKEKRKALWRSPKHLMKKVRSGGALNALARRAAEERELYEEASPRRAIRRAPPERPRRR